ncbi:Hypothetical protein A7982_06896 [Minicystis rosea]|nr:Hypothetical protein A7982_06896 [Minicystis rosea]
MIRLAFIQEKGNGRLDPEMDQVRRELSRRGVPVQLFTEKRLSRRQLALGRDTLVVGYVPIVVGALRQLDVGVPEPNDYPLSLRSHLHRRVWESTVGEVKDAVLDGRFAGAFVKPKGRLKHFTGLVIDSPADLWHLGETGRKQAVFCAEVVAWKSEWRYFILEGRIAGARPYAGDPTIRPDDEVVRAAIATLHEAGEGLRGFGIDFGVLGDGRTALVEMNDGFSLGSYGVEDAVYTDLVMARWGEITGTDGR